MVVLIAAAVLMFGGAAVVLVPIGLRADLRIIARRPGRTRDNHEVL